MLSALFTRFVVSICDLLLCLGAQEEKSIAVISLRLGCGYICTYAPFPFVCPHFRSLLGLVTYIEHHFCGASLLSFAQISVICIDVCFMSPVTQYQGIVVLNLPALHTSQQPAKRAGGGYTTRAHYRRGWFLICTQETTSARPLLFAWQV